MAWHPPTFAHWLGLYAKTLAVEIPVYVWLTRGTVPPRRAALAALACSTITHPILIYLWPRLFTDYQPYIVSGELLVAATEAVVFYLLARPVTWTRAVAVSFIANAASYGVGLLTRYL